MHTCLHRMFQCFPELRLCRIIGVDMVDTVHLDHKHNGTMIALARRFRQLVQVLHSAFCRCVREQAKAKLGTRQRTTLHLDQVLLPALLYRPAPIQCLAPLQIEVEPGVPIAKLQPKVDAFVEKYTEVKEGADKASLTPSGLLAYVATYAEATTGTDLNYFVPRFAPR